MWGRAQHLHLFFRCISCIQRTVIWFVAVSFVFVRYFTILVKLILLSVFEVCRIVWNASTAWFNGDLNASYWPVPFRSIKLTAGHLHSQCNINVKFECQCNQNVQKESTVLCDGISGEIYTIEKYRLSTDLKPLKTIEPILSRLKYIRFFLSILSIKTLNSFFLKTHLNFNTKSLWSWSITFLL